MFRWCWLPILLLLSGCDPRVANVSEEEISLGAGNHSGGPIVVEFEAEGVPVLNSFFDWRRTDLMWDGGNDSSPIEIYDPVTTTFRVQVYDAFHTSHAMSYFKPIPEGQGLYCKFDAEKCKFTWEPDPEGPGVTVTNDSSQECYVWVGSHLRPYEPVNAKNANRAGRVDDVVLLEDWSLNGAIRYFKPIDAGDTVRIQIKNAPQNYCSLDVAILKKGPTTRFPAVLKPFVPLSIGVGVLPDGKFSLSQSSPAFHTKPKQKSKVRR